MRKIKEILRLHYEKRLSARDIAQSLDIGRGTIRNYLDRAERAGLGWPLPPELDDAALEHRLFPLVRWASKQTRPMPPWSTFSRN
jgi:hypothetical protein